ncbi:MAG: threonine--tRNA ligase [Candidatus Paceibacterota bacterium]
MDNKLENIRHSLAHLLGASIMELYPGSNITLGPAVDNGFYYDVDVKGKITDADLEKIENKMKELLKTWSTFEKKILTKDEALKMFAGNVYKEELINGIAEKGEEITIYTSDQFSDLCRGGHASNMKEIKDGSFKVDRVAGAYWRGDEKNKMLTRVYGLAFETKDELDAYILQQEEAKKRDHRELGKKLELFTFDEEIGKGLTIWLPKGNIIKEELENWAKETEKQWGYKRVTTPIITKESLFYTSGHLPLYAESMYAPIKIEDDNYYIKPMNCPFHHKVFSALPKSYKDLPLRLAEYGWCHRYEDSGSLFGLMRVRGMQMNDAHIYTTPEQAMQEFTDVIKLHEYYYKVLGIEKYEMELALRDPKKLDKYHGEEKDWELAEKMTLDAMKASGVPFKIAHEGAAFYGPKMDFQIYSSIGRSFTASTNQLDLYMGKRFGLEYTDKDGTRKTPYIIHRAPLGTHERFIGFLIEHFAGAFPVWLSPVQVIILPISEHQKEYANVIFEKLKNTDVRVELDDSNESLGKRIRNAKMSKVPYVIVIGDKERDANVITIEGRTEKLEGITVETFMGRIQKEIEERTLN